MNARHTVRVSAPPGLSSSHSRGGTRPACVGALVHPAASRGGRVVMVQATEHRPTTAVVRQGGIHGVLRLPYRGAWRLGQTALVRLSLPRGKQGLAPKAYPRWWGWPTSPASYTREGAEQIAKLRAKRRKLEALVFQKFEHVYSAGSSSGAYFVVAVALHGGMPAVDGFGIMSGGSGYQTAELDLLRPRPAYIGFGRVDSVARGARGLGTRLQALGWPVSVAAHSVGHVAREVYLDEAFASWRSKRPAWTP